MFVYRYLYPLHYSLDLPEQKAKFQRSSPTASQQLSLHIAAAFNGACTTNSSHLSVNHDYDYKSEQ